MDELRDFATSEKLDLFMVAFTKLQSMHLSVRKDAENSHFRSTYASLPAVIEASRDGLTQAGFTILQLPLGGLECSRLLNRITHTSGQFIQWVYITPLAKRDPQGIGSAITYSRRYCLTSSLGLPELDDDGNHASTPPQTVRIPEENKSYNDPRPAPAKKSYNDSKTAATGAVKPKYVPRPGVIISAIQLGMLEDTIKRQKYYSREEVITYIGVNYGKVALRELDQVEKEEVEAAIKSRSLMTEPPPPTDNYAPIGEPPF